MTFAGGQADHQLDLPLGGSPGPAMVVRTVSQNKKRPTVRLPVVELPVPAASYEPVDWVPKTRRQCPDTSEKICPHYRCKWFLLRIDGAHRPGRPGLASVPRDKNGRTLPVRGQAGTQRAETTVHPGWLELERTCKVQFEKDDDGHIVGVEPYDRGRNDRWTWRGKPVGSFDLFLRHLQEDETIDVYNDCDRHVARARLVNGTLAFSCVPDAIVVTLVRARGVESCGLDLIERHGKMTNAQIGAVLEDGKYRTTIARIVKAGGRKLREAGVDLRDLLGDEV